MLIEEKEEEEVERERQRICHRCSVPSRWIINRNRIYCDYFSDNHMYYYCYFMRRFCMQRPLFCRIVSTVEAYDPYFCPTK